MFFFIRNFFFNKPQINAELAINLIKDMKFEWVEGPAYWGMVGFDVIYLDSGLFDQFKHSDEMFIGRMIGLLLHEGIHEISRSIFDNFCWITPRIVNKSELFLCDNLEAGFMMEQLIFGDYDLQYWNYPDKILDINNWNIKVPQSLFSKEECNKMSRRGIKNPRNSGLCEHFTKQEF